MSATAGLTASVFGSLFLALAPVPPEKPPDPMARGFLGVSVSDRSCVLSEVQPGLPAAKAGLRAGDVIVRVGTAEPRDFTEVVAAITSYRAGAVVTVEVQRGTERKTFRVKLAPRDPKLDAPDPLPEPVDPDN
jgi:S1-C subfamily serine protease